MKSVRTHFVVFVCCRYMIHVVLDCHPEWILVVTGSVFSLLVLYVTLL
jgi:hypothetical protein